MTVFVKEEDSRYRKFTETHYQRGYTLNEMKKLLEDAGMTVLETVDAETGKAVNEFSERIYVIARECGKKSP